MIFQKSLTVRFQARGTKIQRENYRNVLLDPEVREMARTQVKYSFLNDKEKYAEYSAGVRFLEPCFESWKVVEKAKIVELAKAKELMSKKIEASGDAAEITAEVKQE